MEQQNLQNHTKRVPAFHFFVLPMLLINFGFQVYWWIKGEFAGRQLLSLLAAAAILMGFLTARMMALMVQDRVIRLEERLRYERVLPEELRWRADELTKDQFISLRFASDEELAGLMRKVLDEKVTQRKAIKLLIKNWRPDYMRA